MYGFQSLTGLMPQTDILKVNNLIVKKDATVSGNLEVAGQLLFTEGAAADYVLKSDADGLATWQENTLIGDITGTTGASVQHHKWIGNWDALVPYKQFNRVTHDHVEYRAVIDHANSLPGTVSTSYSLYNSLYPAPGTLMGVPIATRIPDEFHTEIALQFRPNQRGRITHFKFYAIEETSVTIKIYRFDTAQFAWTVYEQTSAVLGTGWQTVELTTPVQVAAMQQVLAAYVTNGHPYAHTTDLVDKLVHMDPAVYIGNNLSTTETVFWYAQPSHKMNENPPHASGIYNQVYLIDVVWEVGVDWEVVLNDRPDTVYEDKAQPLRNKTTADIIDLTVHNGLDAMQTTVRNSFYYKNDGRAEAGKVLTCVGNTGLCDWEWPVQTNEVTMMGDVTGMSNATVVNTLANGTIQVADLVTAADLPPLTDLVYETKAQPLLNKTTADIVDLTVQNSLKLKVPHLNSGVYNLRYLVGYGAPDFNDCGWVDDLHAKAVSAQLQFLYPAGAAAGKVLKCVDSTGLAEWTDFSTTLAGDVTGTTAATVVNTLAGGTIPVNTLVRKDSYDILKNKVIDDSSNVVRANGLRTSTWAVSLAGSYPSSNHVLSFNGTQAIWTSLSGILPQLQGDVTGSVGATVVNSLAGGTIPVDQLVTLTGAQILNDKGFTGVTQFSDVALRKLFRIMTEYSSLDTSTLLLTNSTVDRQIFLPDATDTLVGKNTTDIFKNKTLTDVSNVVHANGIRNGSTWTATFAGAAPATNSVLQYNGTNAVWAVPSLAGDVTGPLNNTVAVKATTDFDVGRFLKMKSGIQIKKLVVHQPGSATDVNGHDFHGFGTSNLMMRYHVDATSNDHVFFAATSATASNELARIRGNGDLTVARTISASNGDRIKKIVLYDGGVASDITDHRYNGFGTSSATLRYQVNAVYDSHVFYAATSATASNELFRIAGDGRTTCRMINAETWRTPTAQGAWMGWNRDGNGSGATTFANQQGGGGGGWEWVNYNSSNVQTPSGAASMTLSRDGNLTVRGKVSSTGLPDVFSANWWSAHDNIKIIAVPLISSGTFANLRPLVTSINLSAWTHNDDGILLPLAGYYRFSYRFRLAAKEKTNMMLCCDVSIGGTNHPSLYTFDMGLTYEHDLHCECIVSVGAPNMWVSYPKLTLRDGGGITSKTFDFYTGHFTIEKMK